jgi:hypothetical protein
MLGVSAFLSFPSSISQPPFSALNPASRHTMPKGKKAQKDTKDKKEKKYVPGPLCDYLTHDRAGLSSRATYTTTTLFPPAAGASAKPMCTSRRTDDGFAQRRAGAIRSPVSQTCVGTQGTTTASRRGQANRQSPSPSPSPRQSPSLRHSPSPHHSPSPSLRRRRLAALIPPNLPSFLRWQVWRRLPTTARTTTAMRRVQVRTPRISRPSPQSPVPPFFPLTPHHPTPSRRKYRKSVRSLGIFLDHLRYVFSFNLFSQSQALFPHSLPGSSRRSRRVPKSPQAKTYVWFYVFIVVS